MALLFPLLLLILSIWVVCSTIGHLRRSGAKRGWWAAFACLCLAGIWLGWSMTVMQYQPSPTLQVHGLPLPVGFFVLEGDGWTDFIPTYQWLNTLANICTWTAILLLTLRLTLWLLHRRPPPSVVPDRKSNEDGEASGFPD